MSTCVPHVILPVPPFLHGSMCLALAARMKDNDWSYWKGSELPDSAPVFCLDYQIELQSNLGIKRTHVTDKDCANCGMPQPTEGTDPRKKCGRCLVVYYCSSQCQRAHWCIHKHVCKAHLPRLEHAYAIAVPDFAVCHQYANFVVAHGEYTDEMPIIIMSRDRFTDIFGADEMKRSILHMAVHGRPSINAVTVTMASVR